MPKKHNTMSNDDRYTFGVGNSHGWPTIVGKIKPATERVMSIVSP
ncbi:unnamed protein product, partial [Rotaria sordida]